MKVVTHWRVLERGSPKRRRCGPSPWSRLAVRPIFLHIMKNYTLLMASTNSCCACGYKGYYIKEFFSNYFLHMSDVTFDMRTPAQPRGSPSNTRSPGASPWSIPATIRKTGGRLKRDAIEHVADEEVFGTHLWRWRFQHRPGLAELAFHKSPRQTRHRRPPCVLPNALWRHCRWTTTCVTSFAREARRRKRLGPMAGSFCSRPSDWRPDRRRLRNLGTGSAPMSLRLRKRTVKPSWHDGFWYPMDTLRDKNLPRRLNGHPAKQKWKIW